MLISRDWIVCGLVVAAGLLSPTGAAQAGLFDSFTPGNGSAGRAQSPEGYLPVAAGTAPAGQPVTTLGYDSGAYAGWCFHCSPCFNCGEYDHYQRCTRRCRACCKSTWYPRVAPYCEPSWGYTQPCWRRAAENYNCVRPDYHASMPKPRRRPQAVAPAEEPPSVPEPPPLPTSSRPSPAIRAAARQTAAYTEPPVTRPEPPPPAIERAPDPSRFTSIADTVESEMDDDDMDDGLGDTLEADTEDTEDDDADSAMIDE